jgi:pantetheine-phosphate adenylyltransferase
MTLKKSILGGTFDNFHKGHEDLLKTVFDLSDSVVIGISSDQFAQRFRTGDVESFKMRSDVINRFCKALKKTYKLIEINDFYGPSTTDPDIEAIVVSEETSLRAKEINAVRTKKGLKKLVIVEVPFTLSEDGKPISSERVREGDVDRDGNVP